MSRKTKEEKHDDKQKGRGLVLVNHIVGPKFPCLSGASAKLQVLNLYSRLVAFVMLSWLQLISASLMFQVQSLPSSPQEVAPASRCGKNMNEASKSTSTDICRELNLLVWTKSLVVQVDKFRRHWRPKQPQTCHITVHSRYRVCAQVLRFVFLGYTLRHYDHILGFEPRNKARKTVAFEGPLACNKSLKM